MSSIHPIRTFPAFAQCPAVSDDICLQLNIQILLKWSGAEFTARYRFSFHLVEVVRDQSYTHRWSIAIVAAEKRCNMGPFLCFGKEGNYPQY
jgi:hypothetical protein